MFELVKKIFKGLYWLALSIVGVVICGLFGWLFRFGVNIVCFVLDLFGVSLGIMDWILHHQTATWIICSMLVPVVGFISIFKPTEQPPTQSSGGGWGIENKRMNDNANTNTNGQHHLGTPNIIFVDCAGNYVRWGESFVDYNGNLRKWGSGFYDADRNYIRWGGTYKDSSGSYRNWGDDFVDFNGNWVHIS